MMRKLAIALLGIAAASASSSASAVAPGILFTPPGNQPGPDVVLVASGEPGQAIASIELSEDPAFPGDGGPNPDSQTTMFCTIGGDANIQFSATPSFSFQGHITGSPSVDLSCEQDATLITTAIVGCFEKRAGVAQPDRIFDVQCPATGAAAAPELDASPVPGSTLAMTSTSPANATQSFTISNTGSANLNVSSITGLAAPFSVAPPNANIAAGNAQLFTVTCNGAAGGVFFDALTVNTNDADEPTVNYQVDCTINTVAGQEYDSVPLPPGPVDLANTVGAPPTTTNITITNVGSGTLTISNLSALSPPLTRSIGNTSLTAGASTDITIGCSSAGATSSSQSLSFNTNDANEGSIAFTVNCNVTAGTAPEFSSSPGTPGPIAINTASGVNGSAQLFVENVGSANLTVSLGAIPTNPPFTVTGLPLNIAPGAPSSIVTVNCNNATPGVFASSFSLSTNDANEGVVPFNVSCNVVAGAAPEFDPVPLPPGPLTITTNQGAVGTANITLRNSGTANLIVSANASPPATFSTLPNPIPAIAPGAQPNLSVRCLNNTPGDYAGTVTLTTNDANEGNVVWNVNCRVNLVAPEFSSTPAAGSTFVFYVQSTQIISVIVRITNLGNATLTYSLSGLSGALTSVPAIGGPYNLAPNASQNIVVSCDGAAFGSQVVQILSVTHNDTGESPANYRIDCRKDIRLDADSVLRAVLGTPLLTDDSVLLLQNGFE
jgi:hypothetical protein